MKKAEPAASLILAALLVAPLAALHAAEPSTDAATRRMSRYNVVWDTPSKDASGAMPIGNGDIAAGVYAIEGGDLYLLLAKNDAYTYEGDIYKTGRVRVALEPKPFQAGKPFRQTLDPATGSIQIEADGVTFCIWADANRPVYHVQIAAPREIAVRARPDLWERFERIAWNERNASPAPADSSPKTAVTQDMCVERAGRILWYFAVGDRSVYPDVSARTSSRRGPSATAARMAVRPRRNRARNTRAGITTITSPAASRRWR